VYTFYLRKNVKFHTTAYFTPTRDFNADDVLFSFQRQLRKDHPFHSVGGGSYQYFQGMGMNSLVTGVTKVDDFTVKVTLSRPEVPFLANLAMNFMSILSQEYGDELMKRNKKDDIDFLPVGTGPFAFQRYTRGSIIRFAAHPEHWRGKPKLDQLIFAITPDASVRYQKLKKGECHLAIYPAPADVAGIMSNPKLKLSKINGLNVGYLALNTEKAPFNNVLVRRAIAHALDKRSYIQAIYLENAIVAKNPIPPTMWSYNNDVAEYDYNPKKAKELLSLAGFPNGFNSTLWTLPVARPFNPNGKKLGEMMQKDLAAVGIKVELMTYDWGTYLEKAKAGEQEMMQLGWTGDNGDPDNFLYTLFSCDSVTKGSNNARFCNQEFDRLIREAREESNKAKRLALYRQAQLVFKQQSPVIPIVHSMVFRAYSEKVKGYNMDPFDQERFFMLDLE
jgi:dipeptide transport system substrate-binding protein